MDEILTKTLQIVSSSTRSMPAHFSSNGTRTQSFCIDFEALNAEDDYNMASHIYTSMSDFISKKSAIPTKMHGDAIIKCAEDIMIGSFIITTLGRKDLIETMKDIIINNTVETLKSKIDNLRGTLSQEEVVNYFNHCAEFGKKTAENSSKK